MTYRKDINTYVNYYDRDEIKDLDRNVWHATSGTIADGASGRHLYKNEPRHPAYYVCSGGRDTETHYLLGIDRDDHPDHTSRFGYGRCPNGYCFGHMPGKYNEPPSCSKVPQPQDMAPARFYKGDYQNVFNNRTQATVDYSNVMGVHL